MRKLFVRSHNVSMGGIMVALLIAGCNASDGTSGEIRIHNTETLTTQPSNTPTSKPIWTPTPLPDSECPEVGSATLSGEANDRREFENVLLRYLNSGGNPDELLEELENESYIIQPNIIITDLNMDGSDEIVFLGHIKSIDANYYQEGGIIFLYCNIEDEYVSHIVVWGENILDPDVYSISNINNDESLEIIYSYTVSRSNCEAGVSITSFKNGKYAPIRIEDNFPDCKYKISLNDINDDGVMEISVEGNTSSSLGGGIGRRVRHTFELNDFNVYQLRVVELLPSEYRIHVLEDAQIALNEGNYESALQIYSVAAHSDQLQDVPSLYDITMKNSDPAHVQYPHEYQTAFALFRMVTLLVISDDLNGAKEILDKMYFQYPVGSPGSAFYNLAELFVNEYLVDNLKLEACTKVTALIASAFPDLDRYIGYWGYNNISYKNETICPFFPNESEE